jgi:hypothetical protein
MDADKSKEITRNALKIVEISGIFPNLFKINKIIVFREL